MKIAALTKPFFSKYKIEERNDGCFYTLKRTCLFWYSYIGEDKYRWHYEEYVQRYCKHTTLEKAKAVLDKLSGGVKASKTKRYIGYP